MHLSRSIRYNLRTLPRYNGLKIHKFIMIQKLMHWAWPNAKIKYSNPVSAPQSLRTSWQNWARHSREKQIAIFNCHVRGRRAIFFKDEWFPTDADILYEALRRVNIDFLTAGNRVTQFLTENLKGKVALLNKVLNKDDSKIVLSTREEHPEWFENLETNCMTKVCSIKSALKIF